MKTTIHSPNAPAAVGPYSQAVTVTGLTHGSGFVFSAGQLGIDPATGNFATSQDSDSAPADRANPNFAAQTVQALKNLKAVLEAAGSDVNSIVKTTIFVTDLAAFKEVNAAYGAFLEAEGVMEPPARSTVQVAALPLGGLVEIEVIALLEESANA